MQSITSILPTIKSDYPNFRFLKSDNFLWSPSDNTVFYDESSDNGTVFLLHELSHGILNHNRYNYDIDLIVMERQAWDKALDIAKKYKLSISDNIIESSMDSYRDWLHHRSTCTNCAATGLQVKDKLYACPLCNNKWKVNEARACALRRYEFKQ